MKMFCPVRGCDAVCTVVPQRMCDLNLSGKIDCRHFEDQISMYDLIPACSFLETLLSMLLPRRMLPMLLPTAQRCLTGYNIQENIRGKNMKCMIVPISILRGENTKDEE